MKLSVINGPNLDKLGLREPHIYGSLSYIDLEKKIQQKSGQTGVEIFCKQTNSESQIIDWIGELMADGVNGLIINPAAYSHTSIAIADAIMVLDIPKVEVHLSNIYAREAFRHHSYISPAVDAVISGCGMFGYELAIDYLIDVYRADAQAPADEKDGERQTNELVAK